MKGHHLVGTESRDLAINRIPAVCGAAGRMARSGGAAARFVEVAVALAAKSGRSAGFAGGADEGAQGHHVLAS